MGATGPAQGPAGFGDGAGGSAATATAAVEAPIREGTDPRPDEPTDPQPLRGPGPTDRPPVDDGWHDA
jgi:hypothetical protein